MNIHNVETKIFCLTFMFVQNVNGDQIKSLFIEDNLLVIFVSIAHIIETQKSIQ
jgi:hypothetical protein